MGFDGVSPYRGAVCEVCHYAAREKPRELSQQSREFRCSAGIRLTVPGIRRKVPPHRPAIPERRRKKPGILLTTVGNFPTVVGILLTTVGNRGKIPGNYPPNPGNRSENPRVFPANPGNFAKFPRCPASGFRHYLPVISHLRGKWPVRGWGPLKFWARRGNRAFSPSPWPSPAGRGSHVVCVWARGELRMHERAGSAFPLPAGEG
ncbi:MAG: hypothetical protein RL514_1362 [Verrucomicrobiota bacterium]